MSGEDFTDSGQSYTISGQVSGGPASGVTIRLTGATTTSVQTDAAGNYSFPNLANGHSYTVTPQLAGYSFSPNSASMTIASADRTGVSFTSTPPSSLLLTVTGKTTYGGTKMGRVYIGVSFTGGDPDNGTSVSGTGSFAVHGLSGQQVPTTVFVTAWMDALGNGRYNAAADPLATTSIPISVVTSTIDAGTLALVDPMPPAPQAPAIDAAVPIDLGIVTVFQASLNGQNNEIATGYNMYWSATVNPGPANHLGVLHLPAGETFAIINGLTNGLAYYVGVSSLVGSNESSISVTGPATAGSIPAPHMLSGTVTFGALPAGAKALYVIAQVNNGIPYIARVANPTSPASYSIQVPDGTYSVFAIVESGMTASSARESRDSSVAAAARRRRWSSPAPTPAPRRS